MIVDKNNNTKTDMLFIEGSDVEHSVGGSDSEYWSKEMKKALSLVVASGFTYQLSLSK